MNTEDWNELAELDPYWSIICEVGSQRGNWNTSTFFVTGERQLEGVMSHADHLGYPAERLSALDFGCGIGRMTRAFAAHFDQVYGVDAAEAMIKLARRSNASFSNCRFLVSAEADLNMFASNEFDMIYSWQVLQNMRNRAVALSIVRECVRALKPNGLLAFQCPSQLPRALVAGRCRRLKVLLKLIGVKRAQLYRPLRALGVSREFLYTRMRLWPDLEVRSIPQDEVVSVLERAGARLLDIKRAPFANIPDADRMYWVTK
jgi:2-polyprenyl-3-methyl-5-hydroxy-6-metoxy-1,4-benzoquinol methylase